jgi:hypothetical protein
MTWCINRQGPLPTARANTARLSSFENIVFCRSFTQYLTPAVDAVGTFSAFTYGLLIAPRVSLCRGNTDALG